MGQRQRATAVKQMTKDTDPGWRGGANGKCESYHYEEPQADQDEPRLGGSWWVAIQKDRVSAAQTRLLKSCSLGAGVTSNVIQTDGMFQA
jgi:hypothetical protein